MVIYKHSQELKGCKANCLSNGPPAVPRRVAARSWQDWSSDGAGRCLPKRGLQAPETAAPSAGQRIGSGACIPAACLLAYRTGDSLHVAERLSFETANSRRMRMNFVQASRFRCWTGSEPCTMGKEGALNAVTTSLLAIRMSESQLPEKNAGCLCRARLSR